MKYNIENYTPLAGKILIKPFKHRTRLVETTESYEDEDIKAKNAARDPLKEEELPYMKNRKVKSRAPYEMQLGEVVAVPKSVVDKEGREIASEYNVGDTIIYSVKFVKEFDLFNKVFLMSNYDVMGTYDL